MPGIVVGVDSSVHSERALSWAMKEAAVRHADLTVLTVHPAVPSLATGNPENYGEGLAPMERDRTAAEELVTKVASELGEQRPASVTVRVVNDSPAKALIDASQDADMLVVGSRGTGGFARLLMGSVSSQVTHHAACPVVVVPHDR
ncbi:MAG: universal stress protein [Streptosporangiaceae bacterium]